MAEFDGPAILAVLARHEVDYLLIGGFAAAAQGSPIPTTDVDIVPATDRDNYARLSAALTELDARVRASGAEPMPFSHDADSLAAVLVWNLTTKFGDLDITAMPAGAQGYDDLRRDAIEVEIRGVRIKLASLADIVRTRERLVATRTDVRSRCCASWSRGRCESGAVARRQNYGSHTAVGVCVRRQRWTHGRSRRALAGPGAR